MKTLLKTFLFTHACLKNYRNWCRFHIINRMWGPQKVVAAYHPFNFSVQARGFPTVFKLDPGSAELGKLTRKLLKMGK